MSGLGAITNVLLSIADYRRLAGGGRKIADLLAMPGVEDIELEIRPLQDPARAADLG